MITLNIDNNFGGHGLKPVEVSEWEKPNNDAAAKAPLGMYTGKLLCKYS